MGRHTQHPTRPRHTARRTPAGCPALHRRVAVPAAVAAAPLAAVPAGTADADDDPPPAGVDGLGGTLGTVLGADRSSGQAAPTATADDLVESPGVLPDTTTTLPGNRIIGEWRVDRAGNGTLSAPNPLGARSPPQAGTMPIRKVEHDFSSATASLNPRATCSSRAARCGGSPRSIP